MSIPSPDPALQRLTFSLFGLNLTIHAYALCILAGIVLATVIASRRLTKRGGEPGIVLEFVLWVVPLGIVAARLYHVFTHPTDYFAAGHNAWNPFQPGSIWAIWEGGNAIYGSLIGGALGVYIACRRTGIRFWSFADAVVPGMLVAQATGRVGNYFNHELFGWPTNLPWGLQIESTNPAFPAGLPAGTLFQPTFLYEILWNLLGVGVILFLERRWYLRWGRAFGIYLIWYGIGRSVFETMRVDPSETFFGIRVNVWASFVAILIGLIILVMQRRRHLGLEPGVYHPGREWEPPATVDSDGESDIDRSTEESWPEAEDDEPLTDLPSGPAASPELAGR